MINKSTFDSSKKKQFGLREKRLKGYDGVYVSDLDALDKAIRNAPELIARNIQTRERIIKELNEKNPENKSV